MHDSKTMLARLSDIGLKCERRAAFESDIADIRQIESEGRTKDAVIVEGKRPEI